MPRNNFPGLKCVDRFSVSTVMSKEVQFMEKKARKNGLNQPGVVNFPTTLILYLAGISGACKLPDSYHRIFATLMLQ